MSDCISVGGISSAIGSYTAPAYAIRVLSHSYLNLFLFIPRRVLRAGCLLVVYPFKITKDALCSYACDAGGILSAADPFVLPDETAPYFSNYWRNVKKESLLPLPAARMSSFSPF